MSFDELESVESVSEALAGQGYLADRPLALAVHLAVVLEQPLLLEGEAGGGENQGGGRPPGATRRAADPAAVPRGDRSASRGLRLGLRAPAAGPAGGGGGRRRGRAVLAPLPAAAPAARRTRTRWPGGAADRRDRPRRRRVRSVPARVPVGLRGHDPRAGDGR